MALFAIIYGPVTGLLIGFIGHTMMDLSWGGSPCWSWILASACVGFVIGLSAKKLNIQDGDLDLEKEYFSGLLIYLLMQLPGDLLHRYWIY